MGQLTSTLGAVVGVVADHGMNDKSRSDGAPAVVYLEEELARSSAIAPCTSSVRSPIRSCATTARSARSCASISARRGDLNALMAACAALPGVEAVVDGPAAARRFGLPLDLEGDFVVRNYAMERAPARAGTQTRPSRRSRS